MGFATSSCIEYGACFKQAAAEAAFFLQIVKKLLQCPPADLTQGRFTLMRQRHVAMVAVTLAP